jgi:cytidylate kinase
MQTQVALEKCLPVLSVELRPRLQEVYSRCGEPPRISVTLSRQSGAGAHVVAMRLAEYLQPRTPAGEVPWSVFDRNLVEKVLEEHKLPGRFARFMPEDKTSAMSEVFDELLGDHPAPSYLVRLTSETILSLARRGHVVLIGRGANLITNHLANVLHVRLVASMDRRTAHIQQTHHLAKKAALELIIREDKARKRYLRQYFGQDPDDPKLYHLVINTDLIPHEQAARMIGDSALGEMHRRQLPRVEGFARTSL